MDKVSGPVVGLAVIAALASGVYAFMLHGELKREKAAVAALLQSADTLRRTAEDANRKSAVARATLDTCNTLLKETLDKLEAATPRAKKR